MIIRTGILIKLPPWAKDDIANPEASKFLHIVEHSSSFLPAIQMTECGGYHTKFMPYASRNERFWIPQNGRCSYKNAYLRVQYLFPATS